MCPCFSFTFAPLRVFVWIFNQIERHNNEKSGFGTGTELGSARVTGRLPRYEKHGKEKSRLTLQQLLAQTESGPNPLSQ